MGEEELRQRDRMVELRAQIINLLQDAWELGYECGAKDISSARTVTLDAMTDAELAEHGLVRLPVDADGEPIHAGDVLDGYGKTIEVVELRYGRSGWVLISRDGNGYADTFAFTHHHAPTVEDVLRDWFVEGKSEFHIGDKVIRKNGRIGTVIGGAIGKDGKHCLVLSMHDGHWRTYLCPIDEARLLKVPTPAQVRTLIMGAIQSAASGDNYNAETAERKADYIMDVAHACFCGEPFPIGGAK